MKELEKLKELIDKYEIISFDIFDTLLLRSVRIPIDVFRILEVYVKKSFGIDDFCNTRVNSERISRTEKNAFETSLDEIYDCVPIDDSLIKEKIKNKEIELENQFLVANPFMKEVFDYCKEKGKQVLCISDMYLPSQYILKFLKKNGYGDVKVYISCEYHKHKGNCTLYYKVHEIEGFDKSKWLHIGDNYESDYNQAIKFGISAYHYRKVSERSPFLGDNLSISASIIYAICNNRVNNGLDIPYWKKFGIQYAAPIYYAFANWIYKNNLDHDNVFFFARDGYIIKKVFDLILKKEKSDIYSSYFYTSRRATQLPLLIYENKTFAVDMLAGVNFQYEEKTKVRNIFDNFDIPLNKYNFVLQKYGFKSEDDIITVENHIFYRQLISELYPLFKEKMSEQVKFIKDYLKQEKATEFQTMNIVDIGWRGSVQYSLSHALENEMFGYYLCTGPYVYSDILYNTRGFLLNYNAPGELSEVIINNMMMFEFLFSAPEGSLIGYKKEKGKILPILDDKVDFINEVAVLQEAALDVIEEFLKYYPYTNDLTSDESLLAYRRFLNEKKYEDIVMVGTLNTNVGYSGSSYNFIKSYSKGFIESDIESFVELTKKSMWHGTFLVEEINTSEEYYNYKNFIEEKYTKIKKKKLLRYLNPKKIIRFIKRNIDIRIK